MAIDNDIPGCFKIYKRTQIVSCAFCCATYHNKPISHIPQCILQISDNEPFCNRYLSISLTKWCIIRYASSALLEFVQQIEWVRYARFNVNTPIHKYKNAHYKDETVVNPPFLSNRNACKIYTTYPYWIGLVIGLLEKACLLSFYENKNHFKPDKHIWVTFKIQRF